MLFGILYDRPNGHRYAFLALALNVLGCALMPHVTGHADSSGASGDVAAGDVAAGDAAGGSVIGALSSGGGAEGQPCWTNATLAGAVAGRSSRVSHVQLAVFAFVYGLGYGGVLTIVASKVHTPTAPCVSTRPGRPPSPSGVCRSP